MNAVITTWLPAEEEKKKKKTEKNHRNVKYFGKKEGARCEVYVFYNLLLQNCSSTLVNVLVFFVSFFFFFEDKSKTGNNRKYVCWLYKPDSDFFFFQLRFWGLVQR